MNELKKCTICGNNFTPRCKGQNTCCFSCRQIKKRDAAKKYARNKRYNKVLGKCYICGYDKAIDNHHEGGKEYKLCPNCHALLTRGYSTLEELLLLKRTVEKV
jgi:hypothetical protein